MLQWLFLQETDTAKHTSIVLRVHFTLEKMRINFLYLTLIAHRSVEPRILPMGKKNRVPSRNTYGFIKVLHLFPFHQEQQEEDQESHRSSTSRLSRSPLRSVKKVKMMQCKITLLDGSDYSVNVEVSLCRWQRLNVFNNVVYNSIEAVVSD